jgi:hypothetical protein
MPPHTRLHSSFFLDSIIAKSDRHGVGISDAMNMVNLQVAVLQCKVIHCSNRRLRNLYSLSL